MHFDRPTLRDLAIGFGLLRPLRRAEENDALRKCTAYLERRIHSSSRSHVPFDQQLAIAVLEHWLTL